ncbi:hypothetical protein Dsin_012111 [Dipteronia sinensis]|uniref:Uncharacterized protein n=1 Tax=Dipteronia sinensis TaxID=43782 RepID=A0AAE0AHG5_9ROSI|nr:hypothetical protein Dsin_012111 [Dipteronia sinensis]
MGDFKKIVNSGEKIGGRNYFSKTGFTDWISENEHLDIGFVGQKFTWMTRKGIFEKIWERLDRALCSMEWTTLFVEGFVRYLPRTSSDHCPIMLILHISHVPRNPFKPFRFEAMRMKHEDFGDLVLLMWAGCGENVMEKVSSLSDKLRVWNRDSFGCLFQNKKRILVRLLGVQRSLGEKFRPSLAKLELKLRKEYNLFIEQEEIF